MSPPASASPAGPGSILPLGGEHPGPNADRLQQDLCLLEGEVALIVVRRDPEGWPSRKLRPPRWGPGSAPGMWCCSKPVVLSPSNAYCRCSAAAVVRHEPGVMIDLDVLDGPTNPG